MQKIEKQRLYRHYKGNIYKIIDFAKHSETLEDMIIYKSVKTEEVWVRPYKMWNDTIDEAGTLRFTLIEENDKK